MSPISPLSPPPDMPPEEGSASEAPSSAGQMAGLLARHQVALFVWGALCTIYGGTQLIHNETDVLPVARQFIQPGWLPNDWYLNLHFGYRDLFSALTGGLFWLLDFGPGAFLGRVCLFAFYAYAVARLLRWLELGPWATLVCAILAVVNPSLVAGEWMSRALETKAVAYPFALLAAVAWGEKRYTRAWAFSGLALSFHVLVGLSALFCAGCALLVTARKHRPHLHSLASGAWLLPLTGAGGLMAIVAQLRGSGAFERATEAALIYVRFRVPHHTLPSAWRGGLWPYLLLAVLAGVFGFAAFRARPASARFLGAYGLGSVLLFLMGLAVYATGRWEWLKYYWFRYPDTLAPFLGVALLSSLVGARLTVRPHAERNARIAAVLVLLAAGVLRAFMPGPRPAPHHSMLAWIRENTPAAAVFWVEPSMNDFYVRANRAMFVSFKHVPQSEPEILEWFERLALSNGGRTPEKTGFAGVREIRDHFYALNSEQVRSTAARYGLQFFLGRAKQPLDLDVVHQEGDFVLYRTGAGPRAPSP